MPPAASMDAIGVGLGVGQVSRLRLVLGLGLGRAWCWGWVRLRACAWCWGWVWVVASNKYVMYVMYIPRTLLHYVYEGFRTLPAFDPMRPHKVAPTQGRDDDAVVRADDDAVVRAVASLRRRPHHPDMQVGGS